MKAVLDASEVIGTVQTPEGERHVCAAAAASYDEAQARLTVKLDAFLRSTELRNKEARFPADWLPKPEVVREAVGPEEAVEMARDIFQGWARKVHERVPLPGHH